jgi:two-component system, OmpR family, KDP operon response regulator KdpE
MTRILLVEDNDLNRSLVRAILKRAPDPDLKAATIVDAPTLADARTALGHGDTFDVILLDMHLPDGSGLSLAEELNAADAARPPIVALTAAVLPAEQAATLNAGCDAFIAKPYTSGQLLEAIGRLVPQQG